MELPDLANRMSAFLAFVLVVSIIAGSLLMAAVSFVLLAIFLGLAYRARVIRRSLDRTQGRSDFE